DLLGRAGGDPPEVGGGVLPLADDLLVLVQFLGGHRHLAGATRDPRPRPPRAPAGACGWRWSAAARALSSALMTVSSAMPFSRSRKRSSSIGIFTSPSSRCGWSWVGVGGASPRQHHLPPDPPRHPAH